MYNDTYINSFSSDDYEKYLSHPSLLTELKDEYLKLYHSNSNAKCIAFKESLDHFVLKQLSTNPNFKNTQYFKNYCAYLSTLIKEATFTIDGKVYYPEVNKNVIFTNSSVINTVVNELSIQKEELSIAYKNHIEKLKTIYNLLKNHKPVTQEELIVISDYIYGKRNLDKEIINTYIEYMYNDLPKNIKNHPSITGALLSCFALVYNKDEKVNKDSRFFVCDMDHGKLVDKAHSNPDRKYCVFSKSYLDDIDLYSCESLKYSRTFKHKDIYWMMMVAFHELTHQVQDNERERKTLSSSSISKSINIILQKYMPTEYDSNKCVITDYDVNHDKDETELEADEEAWKQMNSFIKKYIRKENDKYIYEDGKTKYKSLMAFENAEKIRIRRTFSMKKNVSTIKREVNLPTNKKSIGKYFAHYDIGNLIKIVQQNPNLLEQEPVLKNFFNQDGTFNPIKTLEGDLLNSNDETTYHQNNAAYELYTYSAYFYSNKIYNEINTNGISETDAKNLLSSLRYIYWGGSHKFSDFSKIKSNELSNNNITNTSTVNRNQYTETDHGYNFYNQNLIENTFLYHYSVIIKVMITEQKIYNLIKQKYPNYKIRDVGVKNYLSYIEGPIQIIIYKIKNENDKRFIELFKNPKLLNQLVYVKNEMNIPEIDELVDGYIELINSFNKNDIQEQSSGVSRK